MSGVAATPPRRLFPLVRHLSFRLTPLLASARLHPNHVTGASLVLGLLSAWLLAGGTRAENVWAALLLTLAYVLDNCDGELARLTGTASPFGLVFDTTVDWLVHTALFLGLGLGTASAFDAALWAWLGFAAAIGTTINSAISIPRDIRTAIAAHRQRPGAAPAPTAADAGANPGTDPDASHEEALPTGVREHFLYVFRELSRADFCFIVLLLAPFGGLWLLLPAGAIGAQVYWLTGLMRGAGRFHV